MGHSGGGGRGRLLHYHGVSHGDGRLLYGDSLAGYNWVAWCLLHDDTRNRRGNSWRRLLYHDSMTRYRGHYKWRNEGRLYHDSVSGGIRVVGLRGTGHVGWGRVLCHRCWLQERMNFIDSPSLPAQ